MQFAKRDGVAALEVAGGEAAGFLNDLLTAQIANLEAGQAQAACLLTPQGRILFDMMVFCVSQERFWLQLPADEINAFQKRLMMYRLRRPVEIKTVAHWQSAIIFDSSAMLLEKPIQGAFADPRDGWEVRPVAQCPCEAIYVAEVYARPHSAVALHYREEGGPYYPSPPRGCYSAFPEPGAYLS